MNTVTLAVALTLFSASLAIAAEDAEPGFHEDYYVGFSQGVYYGLMLAGEDYHVAWCMKSELEYEAKNLGTGGEFQSALERILGECQEQFAPADPE